MEHTENKGIKDLLTNLWCMLLAVLRQWRVLLCVVLLAGMAADVVRTLTYRPRYSASVQAVVRTERNTYQDLEGVDYFLNGMGYILNGHVAQAFVRDALQAPDAPLTASISKQSGTNQCRITLVSDSRQHAYHGLDLLLDWYGQKGPDLDGKYTLYPTGEITFSQQPTVPNRHGHSFLLGAGVSGVLTVVFLALLDFMRKSVRTPEDVERNLSCRLLARIPRERKPRGKQFWKRSKKAVLISSVKTGLPYREAIRKLRHKLESSVEKHGYQSVLITSAGENEGKSSIVANLALSLAMNGHSVLLLDCDLLKPAIHKIFEQNSADRNLNAYLLDRTGQSGWKDQVVTLPRPKLSLLMAQPSEHTEELLESGRLKKLLEEARKEYDYIIIDTPPAGSLSDAVQLNALADVSLLVVRQDSSSCAIINETIARMSTARNNLLGCVYNARYTELSAGAGRDHTRSYSYGRER